MLAHLKTSTINFRQRREWKPAWTTIAIERSRKMSSDDICYNLLLAAKNINTLSLQWYSLCWSRPMWLCLWIPSSFVFTTRLKTWSGVRSYVQCGCIVLAKFWRLVRCSNKYHFMHLNDLHPVWIFQKCIYKFLAWGKIQVPINCIWMIYLQSQFLNVSSNGPPEKKKKVASVACVRESRVDFQMCPQTACLT